MNSSRRDFLLRTGLVSLGGSGLLLSACGGGGGGTGGGTGGGGTGGGGEGLLNYGSQELPTKAYGKVPTARSASGSITSTTNLSLPGVATIIGSKCDNISGHSLSINASLDVAKAVTFIATVPAEITSRISYGIDILVSSIQDSGKVHVAIDLPVEMLSKDPNTIVVGAYLLFEDSDGFVALDSAVSDDKRTVGVDVPASVFEEVTGQYLAHLVVAEMPVSRKPGSRPVDYDPDNQELLVLDPDGIVFSHPPILNPATAPFLDKIEITSRTGMREFTNGTKRNKHVGIDLRVVENETTVHAVADGILISLIDFRIKPGTQGNFVSILHDGGFATQYLHLASLDVSLLRKLPLTRLVDGVYKSGPIRIPIKAGDILGRAGNTSTASLGPHLHLNVVPFDGAWANSAGHYVVYNPELLLAGSLVKPELIAEFLYGYESKKYKTDDQIEISVDAEKTAYLSLFAKDSVFRDVPLPSDDVLLATSSDTTVATVSIESGRVKIVAKKIGDVRVKVVYTSSTQKDVKAYGELRVNISKFVTPLLDQYKKEMRNINGQFKMGRTEVTVGMWKEYCQVMGIEMPRAPSWGWIDSHPIVNVDTGAAIRFATWAGLRLPSYGEWMLAAAGGNSWNFPWGGDPSQAARDGWDPSKCVHSVAQVYIPGEGAKSIDRPRLTSTAPVGSIPAGDSPFGCSDMSGNVLELLGDRNYPGDYVVAPGGCWASYFSIKDLALRNERFSTHDGFDSGPSDKIGFRLAGPIE